jgi:type II secretory pathway component GspD/PulD (secretin)
MTTTSGIDSPTVMKRSVFTTVDVRDGDIIILAGLNEERESSGHSGFVVVTIFFF